jgi:hypothetical protein
LSLRKNFGIQIEISFLFFFRNTTIKNRSNQMENSDSLNLDSLIEDNSKLNLLLNHLKQNPNEITKTVHDILQQAREKDLGIQIN